jgi:hypothetical protein
MRAIRWITAVGAALALASCLEETPKLSQDEEKKNIPNVFGINCNPRPAWIVM